MDMSQAGPPKGDGHAADTDGHDPAWIRARERRTLPAEPWKEQREDFTKRLQSICQDINSNCDVEGLCNRFPARVQAVVDAKGDRINK